MDSQKIVKNLALIICTRNRRRKLIQCLFSLKRNDMLPGKTIIVDQNDLPAKIKTKEFAGLNLKFINDKRRGVSRARNLAIEYLKNDKIIQYLFFIDDDCLLKKDSISKARHLFSKYNPDVLLGNLYPYPKTKKKHHYCPASIKRKQYLLSSDCFSLENIGVGAVMAFKKKVFSSNRFKEWLGTGTITCAGEETELIAKLCFQEAKILFDPQLSVYHDRWITKDKFEKQRQKYLLGTGAAVAALILEGFFLAGREFLFLFKRYFDNFFKSFRYSLIKFNLKRTLLEVKKIFTTTVSLLSGFLLGLFFSLKEK